jgi:hypothetical protein
MPVHIFNTLNHPETFTSATEAFGIKILARSSGLTQTSPAPTASS